MELCWIEGLDYGVNPRREEGKGTKGRGERKKREGGVGRVWDTSQSLPPFPKDWSNVGKVAWSGDI